MDVGTGRTAPRAAPCVASDTVAERLRKKCPRLGKLLSLSYVLLLRLGKNGRRLLPMAHNVLGCHDVSSLLCDGQFMGQSDLIGNLTDV